MFRYNIFRIAGNVDFGMYARYNITDMKYTDKLFTQFDHLSMIVVHEFVHIFVSPEFELIIMSDCAVTEPDLSLGTAVVVISVNRVFESIPSAKFMMIRPSQAI